MEGRSTPKLFHIKYTCSTNVENSTILAKAWFRTFIVQINSKTLFTKHIYRKIIKITDFTQFCTNSPGKYLDMYVPGKQIHREYQISER